MKAEVRSIAIIGTAGLPSRYGGFETLAHYLTENLGNDHHITVYCPKTLKSEQLSSYNGAKLRYLPFSPNGVQGILYDIVSILESVWKHDKLLILGSGGSIILPFLLFFKHKFCLNFGGLEWARDKWPWIAQIYLKLTERIGILFSETIIADNQHFVNYISNKYGKTSTLIEYGGDHCVSEPVTASLLEKYTFLNKSYYLSISRAQVDNNLHMVLEAFCKLPNKKLVLISNWHISGYGKNLLKQYSMKKNIILLDAVYDLQELNAIRGNCFAYIHSHSFCGTAPSLVEMMHLGKPIFCYDANTNHYTTEENSQYFKNSNELVALIQDSSLESNSCIADNMKKIANRRYTWETISSKYLKAMFG